MEYNAEDIYTFVEPHYTGGTATIEITAKEAVTHIKEEKETKLFKYDSDIEALRDFCTIHWATKKEL